VRGRQAVGHLAAGVRGEGERRHLDALVQRGGGVPDGHAPGDTGDGGRAAGRDHRDGAGRRAGRQVGGGGQDVADGRLGGTAQRGVDGSGLPDGHEGGGGTGDGAAQQQGAA